MRSFTIKNIFTLVLLTAMLVVGEIGMVKGQGIGRVYAKYLNLTGIKGTAGTGGLGGGALGDYSINNPLYLNNNDLTAYAELKAISGTGVVLGTGGGATTAVLNLNFPGGDPVSSGTPIIIKLSAENKDNLTVEAYNSVGILVGSATPLTSNNSVQEFVFTLPAAFSTIRITSMTGLSGLLGVPTTNNIKIYYAYYLSAPTLTSNNVTICSGSQAYLSVSNTDPTLTYKWYTTSTNGIPVNAGTAYSPIVSENTSYYVETTDGTNASLSRTAVAITATALPTIKASPSKTTVPIGTSVTLNVSETNASTIDWYDSNGVLKYSGVSYNLGIQNTKGTFSYTAIAHNGPGTCTNSVVVNYSVYSPTECPELTERVYADKQSTTGNVLDATNAIDKDPKSGSLLNPILDILGLLSPTQSLLWNDNIPAGIPVTVKLGPDPALLSLITGISIIGLKKTGTNSYAEIAGSLQSVNVSLLNLLSGENSFEYQFIPRIGTVPQEYAGIKIIFSSVLAIGKTLKVFEAYHLKSATSIDCQKKDVIDILYGAEAPLTIGAATISVNVKDPWFAVDKDVNTFAKLNADLAVAAYAKEQIIFSSPSLATDSIRIIVSASSSILNLQLISGFSIQRYLGTSAVGVPILSNSQFLKLTLLNGGTKSAIVLLPTTDPYDRIEIRLGGVVGAFSSINIHEVERIANTKVTGSNDDNQISVCQGQSIFIPNPTNDCTQFEWYDDAGAKINNTSTKGLELNTTGYNGTKKFFIQPVRYGCNTAMSRGIVTVTVNHVGLTPGTLSICQDDLNVFLPYNLPICNPTEYKITWDNLNFVNTASYSTLPANSIPITVPDRTKIGPGVYTGKLSVKNSTETSADIPIQLTIKTTPGKPSVSLQ